MVVYFVVDPWEGARVRVRIVSDASSTAGSASRPAGQGRARQGRNANPRSAGVAHRARTRCKRAAILGLAVLAVLAIGSGAFAGLAATPIAVTVAITLSVVSGLLSVRLILGSKLTNELASWIALAASVAGLAFAITGPKTGQYEQRPLPVRTAESVRATSVARIRDAVAAEMFPKPPGRRQSASRRRSPARLRPRAPEVH
jgi:hypothetical protein